MVNAYFFEVIRIRAKGIQENLKNCEKGLEPDVV
jgi:hypothetical protein